MDSAPAVTTSSLDVVLADLPLRERFAAGHGTTSVRTITLVRVETDVGPGWGECSALPDATYTAEWAAGAYQALTEAGPMLIGRPLTPTDMGPIADNSGVELGPMARAGLEMALLDAHLKATGRPLARWLGATAEWVRAGVSIGLDTVEATVDRAVQLADDGYPRLKVKVQPGHDLDLVLALRARLPKVELHVDANGTYGPDGVDQLQRMVDAGVDAVEQPFAPDRPDLAGLLIERLTQAGLERSVPVVADEAVQAPGDYEPLHRAGGLSGLSIKPPRVGGVAAAVELHDRCRADRVPATAGGMLETGLGRHALAAVAALPGFTLTGDLSPAGRWLAADPWPDLTMTDGRLKVPTEPGVAPPPDRELLHRYTRTSRRIDKPAAGIDDRSDQPTPTSRPGPGTADEAEPTI